MARPDRGERLIFCGGNPRSGTTLMQNIMDSHPDIWGGPEFDQLPNIAVLRREMLASVAKGRIDVFCDREDIDDAIASLYERLMLPAADRAGCRYLSERHPESVIVFGDLMEVFPAARFIFIVRDPRAVISSLLQVGLKASRMGMQLGGWYADVNAAINSVKEVAGFGFEAARKAPERVLVTKYEVLVDDPEAETRRWCEFLSIPWDRKMLYPSRKKHPGEKAQFIDKRNTAWYDRETYHKDPDTTAIDKWRRDLPPELQRMISDAFRNDPDYSSLGYDFGG